MEAGQQSEQVLAESSPRSSSEGDEDYKAYQTGQNVGKWNQEENAKYIVFLQCYRNKLTSRQGRRTTKFYKKMAQFILTRNSLQCRTHHQKLEAKYRYPNRIISDYKKSTDLALYHVHKEQFHQKHPEFSATKDQRSLSRVQKDEAGIQTELNGTSLTLIPEQEWDLQAQERTLRSQVLNVDVNRSESQLWHTEANLGAVPFFYYPYLQYGSL